MNVQEVLKMAKERKSKTKEIIKRIAENIHKKIKYYAGLKKESCVYTVPTIINDNIVYEYETVVKDLFKILDQEGYIVSAYTDGRLDICWNEQLVEQKVKADAYILDQQERKLKNVTRKAKKIDERFAFLANPLKTGRKELTIDEQLDAQVEKILREKSKEQKKMAKKVK